MINIHPLWIAAFFGATEIIISTLLRSRTASGATDKGSLKRLWAVINVCMVAAILAFLYVPQASFAEHRAFYLAGMIVFWLGVALRWYSIAYLGRFFTVDVAVAKDQRVIDSGPYRLVRHPSYTGVLMAFYGVALLFSNYISLLLIIVPITAVFFHRMKVEEEALLTGLGENYRAYMERTKRLIPFLY